MTYVVLSCRMENICIPDDCTIIYKKLKRWLKQIGCIISNTSHNDDDHTYSLDLKDNSFDDRRLVAALLHQMKTIGYKLVSHDYDNQWRSWTFIFECDEFC